MRIALDIECTYTVIQKRKNPSPYLDTNRIVSVGYVNIDTGEEDYLIFNHKESEGLHLEDKAKLQAVLDKTTLLIAHNAKFDLSWLYECGYTYTGELYDTMIAEYVFAKGQKIPLSLKASCERYGLSAKSDVLGAYFDQGLNTDEIPLAELIEYGLQDIKSTRELYEYQQALIASSADHTYMRRAVNLMNETLPVLIDVERAGICIDTKALDEVEVEYRNEYNTIKARLQETILHVMGHTPINLESPEHLSMVLYSRKVKDKNEWKDIFNLGTEIRNSVVKVKYSRRLGNNQFINIVRSHTDKVYKTEAKQCECCKGYGFIQKVKKDGANFKKTTKCSACDGVGFIYESTGKIAGFRLSPISSEYAATGGFSSDKVTLLELLKDDKLKPMVRSFLTDLLRLNAIATYLTTFVEGIKRNVKDNILHCNFNMCLTATGRLSSSNPNFQNLPRGKTFPVRKVIVSRFKNGKILAVDFEKFEFTVAAILSGCEQARKDILDGVDVHIFTMETLNKRGMNIDRTGAKSRTFAPLYGASKGNNDAEKEYYREFLEKYKGIAEWHKLLENEALTTRQIKTPSGRIYAFPNVKRMPNGSVLGQTQIKNYIVQGFATGDITPIALIEIYKRLKGLQSKIFLTVHDDISIDMHPDEITQVITIVRDIFNNMNNLIEQYFNLKTDIPVKGEISLGDNWMNKTVIHG